MSKLAAYVGVVALGLSVSTLASAQTPAASANTDVYEVTFSKAAPGQADALAKALMTPDSTEAMPTHFVLLRHQEGDDWDFCLIQHMGTKATVDAGGPGVNAATALRAWHDDTYVSGPSWAEFTKQMATAAGTTGATAVYDVSVFRAVPGHRDQLLKALDAAPTASKIQTGAVTFQHMDGAAWQFMTITRYNSWQDLGTDRAGAAAAAAGTAGGWGDMRQHASFHRDTIADRLYPK